jgi:hypothetical protein
MLVDQLDITVCEPKSLLSLRLLGTLGMLGSPMLLIEGVYRHFADLDRFQDDRVVGILSIIYILGFMASALGIRRVRATGRTHWSEAVFAIQMAGLLLALVWAIGGAFSVDLGSTVGTMTDLAWPFSHLFMLVVAGFILKAGVWRGWKRLPPFLCGLALPGFFIGVAFGQRDASGWFFTVTTAVGFLLLGYAVRTYCQDA